MGRSSQSPRPAAALRGRFGRRLFVLFLGCASVPLAVFAWSASHMLADELRKDCEARLHDSVKSAGMNLAARLLQLRDDLDAACAELRHGGVRGLDGAPETMRQRLQDQFRCLAVHAGGRVVPVVGTAPAGLQAIDAKAQEHLAAGRTLLQRGPAATPDGTWPMSLLRRLDPGLAASPIVVAEIQAAGLWSPEVLGAPRAEVVVYDGGFTELFRTCSGAPPAQAWRASSGEQPSAGTFEWQVDGAAHLARFWRLFLRPQFGADLWVVHSWPRDRVLAPLAAFQDSFVLVALATLLAVALLSIVQIRKTMRPIRELHAATEAMAAGDLSAIVAVDTPDEIGDLARAFNRMSGSVSENVLRRAQSERELLDEHERALVAVRAKAEFLTNVSHEFRTPLAAVIAMAELLRDGGDADPATRSEFLGGIVDRAHHLESLIERVLEVTSGGAYRREPCDVAATVRAAIAAVAPARRGRIQFEADGLPTVSGDAERLATLWGHLLDNALRFSPDGSPVQVAAVRSGDFCRVDVVDRGCGIAAEHHQLVFEAFQQICTDHLTDKVPGAGLGLTLALMVARQHGGTIEIESTLGEGSRFRVWLPSVAGAADPDAGRQSPTAAAPSATATATAASPSA